MESQIPEHNLHPLRNLLPQDFRDMEGHGEPLLIPFTFVPAHIA
jgi:hypothetical protein